MKRVFAVLLVAVLLAGVLSANVLSYAYAALQVVGDVNGDGRVNNRDLGNLQQVLNDWDVTASAGADVNGDGSHNNRDMGDLQQILNGGERVPMFAPAAKYVELGAPAAAYYDTDYIARAAWDMAIYDGRLYVGCGNFGTNSGPTPVLSCPLDDVGNWSAEGTVPDEQVMRFVNLNGRFLIPGCDPVGRPQKGYYYELDNGEWQTYADLPHGLHNFDLTWFHGRVYAAIGTDRGDYPVAYTEDGVRYETLPFYKDGVPRPTDQSDVIRSCNLYVLGDTLYADFWYESEDSSRTVFEMYRYNEAEDRFDYVADLKDAIHGGQYGVAGLPLWGKAALGEWMFLTTGYLYYTTDFIEYTELELPNGTAVYDMVMGEDGRLYLLASYVKDDGYQITVYSIGESNPTALRTETAFFYSQMPTAFAVADDCFFIGTGDWYGIGAEDNGMILQVER